MVKCPGNSSLETSPTLGISNIKFGCVTLIAYFPWEKWPGILDNELHNLKKATRQADLKFRNEKLREFGFIGIIMSTQYLKKKKKKKKKKVRILFHICLIVSHKSWSLYELLLYIHRGTFDSG